MPGPVGTIKKNSGISVPFDQLHESLTESADRDGIYASVTYKVAWADRWKFYQDIMGKHVTYGSGTSQTWVRYVPATYPDNTRLYANALRMVPQGKSSVAGAANGGFVGKYDWAFITVDFATPPFLFDGETAYRTEAMSFSGEILQLPQGSYIFPDGTPVTQTIGITMPSIELSVTTHQMPIFPLPFVLGTIGTVNGDVWYGADPGTMLFLGCETSRKATVMGSPSFEVNWKFHYRPFNWNKLKHPILPTFEFAFQKPNPETQDEPVPIYQYSDFSQLPV